jgi:hypothetical protein
MQPRNELGKDEQRVDFRLIHHERCFATHGPFPNARQWLSRARDEDHLLEDLGMCLISCKGMRAAASLARAYAGCDLFASSTAGLSA